MVWCVFINVGAIYLFYAWPSACPEEKISSFFLLAELKILKLIGNML